MKRSTTKLELASRESKPILDPAIFLFLIQQSMITFDVRAAVQSHSPKSYSLFHHAYTVNPFYQTTFIFFLWLFFYRGKANIPRYGIWRLYAMYYFQSEMEATDCWFLLLVQVSYHQVLHVFRLIYYAYLTIKEIHWPPINPVYFILLFGIFPHAPDSFMKLPI